MSLDDVSMAMAFLAIGGAGLIGGFLWGHHSGYKQAFSEARSIAPLLPDTYTLEEIRRAWVRTRRATKTHQTDYDVADLIGALERPEE